MGLLSLFIRTDINAGVRRFREDPGSVLLDVREREEYAHRRIPGSRNLPLSQLDRAPDFLPDKDVHLYVYCYGGSRSGQAVKRLKRMGYTAATDIGGIKGYTGPDLRGSEEDPQGSHIGK